MGVIYSKISNLHLNDNAKGKTEGSKENKDLPKEIIVPKTPISAVPKFLLDPRSATAEIDRTPIMIMHEVTSGHEDGASTPLRPPYLETDLDSSVCTIRTSTPIMSDSPMKDLDFEMPPSPVLRRNDSFNSDLSVSQQDELFNLDSEDEDYTYELFNNERKLFDSDDQDSSEESFPDDDVYVCSEGSCEIDHESVDSKPTQAENSLERQFSEIEDCVFSAVNQSVEGSANEVKLFPKLQPQFKIDNHLAKTKNGRTPLGIVSSNPCSPLKKDTNLLIDKDAEVTKTWRGLNEERANRGLLDVENTPPPATLPPPDIIQSAPGKLLIAKRARIGKAAWGRDNSLII